MGTYQGSSRLRIYPYRLLRDIATLRSPYPPSMPPQAPSCLSFRYASSKAWPTLRMPGFTVTTEAELTGLSWHMGDLTWAKGSEVIERLLATRAAWSMKGPRLRRSRIPSSQGLCD